MARFRARCATGCSSPHVRWSPTTARSSRVVTYGTFMIAGVLGRARIAVANLPAGWTQKAILHDGQNLAGKPIDITDGGAVAGVQVVLSNRTTTVAGQGI